jgi:thiamine pyrophosphate-dependent acetolactate synthase large subunit-like protein
MKASDVFVKALENEGVEYIFGLPEKRIWIFWNPFTSQKK